MMPPLKIVLASDNTSLRMGGEAAISYHVFRTLRERGEDVRLVTHERNEHELRAAFPHDTDRLHFIEETPVHRWAWKLIDASPKRLGVALFGAPIALLVQRSMLRTIRGIIARHGCDVVHQLTPVAPRLPSAITKVPAAMIIGPMNGNIHPPTAFSGFQGRAVDLALEAGRRAMWILNLIVPGKRRADTLLVANERTAGALPRGCTGRVIQLVENGIDPAIWDEAARAQISSGGTPHFVFVGRLVRVKAVDLLLEAFRVARATRPAHLDIVGDGEERDDLEAHVARLGLTDHVTFHGYLSQSETSHLLARARAMVMPSLAEAGGAVVLEAMATARPVIATAWGGPGDYLDPSCGILVEPDSRDALVNGFAAAMVDLADHPERARQMGEAGHRLVHEHYTWDEKAAALLGIYADTVRHHSAIARTRRATHSWA
jgi:glycosyltransferase involved in cell wall biosynthesis